MFVYFGTAFKSLAEVLSGDVQVGIAQQALLGAGLVVTIVVTVYVTRMARRAIRQYVETDAPAVSEPAVEGAP